MKKFNIGGTTLFLREIEEKLTKLFKEEGRVFGFQLYIAKELENSIHTLRLWPKEIILYIADEDHDLKVLYSNCYTTITASTQIGRVVKPKDNTNLNVFCHLIGMEDVRHISDKKVVGTILIPVSTSFKEYIVYGWIKDGELTDFETSFEESK